MRQNHQIQMLMQQQLQQQQMMSLRMQNGGAAGPQDVKPGDWFCTRCTAHNFATKSNCFKCSAPVAESKDAVVQHSGAVVANLRPGDWICDNCKTHNFASKTACFVCKRPGGPVGSITTPTLASGAVGSSDNSFVYRSKDPPANMRAGDWMCEKCNGHNFASKASCFQCAAPKPAQQLTASNVLPPPPQFAQLAQFPPVPPANMRPGDWMCDKCGKHNFASKMACFGCGVPRPMGAGGAMMGMGAAMTMPFQ